MTNSENFKQIVDHIFGKDVVKVKGVNPKNKVIGALNTPDKYDDFKKNFTKRLLSLKGKFEKTAEYKKVLDQVALIADDKNWEGAYAELAAYDIFNNDFADSLEIDKTLPVTDSFALEMGHKETNEDGYLPYFDSYFDVKILSDTVKLIISSVIDEVKKNLSLPKECHIVPQYRIDDDNEQYQKNRRKLVEELKDALNALKDGASKTINSRKIPDLKYIVCWNGCRTIMTVSSYEPYRNAMNWHNVIYQRYTKKILKNKKFYLVLVNFPWYNNLVSDAFDNNGIFYRALSRRVFMENRYTGTQLNAIVPKFRGTQTAHEVSQHITGLIYIDDFSISKDGGYASYIYLNPNAVNKPGHMEMDYFYEIARKGMSGKGIVDTLEYDNY